jgi:hypothetical protein
MTQNQRQLLNPPGKRSKPHIPLATTITIIFILPPFVPALQPSSRVPANYHRYPSPYYQPYNYNSATSQSHSTHPTSHHLPSTTATDNLPHNQHPINPAKNGAQYTTTSTSTTPSAFTTKQQLPNLQNHPHNHRRLQPRLPK